MIARLALTDFRNHAAALVEPGPGFVLLSGPNGAGKTNVLEAASLLTPGRGLRQVPISEMARSDGAGGFSVAARLSGEVDLGTGTIPTAPDRRQVRINAAAASVNSLSEWLSVLWLTPAMDRLFTDSAGARRRFLDRLTLALEPGHATHAARYEAAMRARNKLLAEPDRADPQWLAALEIGMAEHGAALGDARARTVAALTEAMADNPRDDFPRASLALDGWDGNDLATALKSTRGRDAAAGRAWSARTVRISPSRTSSSANPPRAARPASRRRCCSVSSSPMPISSQAAATRRQSSCSTKSPPISTPPAAKPCSPACPAAARSG